MESLTETLCQVRDIFINNPGSQLSACVGNSSISQRYEKITNLRNRFTLLFNDLTVQVVK